MIQSWKVFEDKRLTTHQAMVYICLCKHQGKHEFSFPSHKTIAKEVHCCVTTVKTAINKLVELGYLEKKRQYRPNGGRTTNLYKCLI